MRFSDPRNCWRCGGVHVGRCATVANLGPSRQDAETRLNAFLFAYAARVEDAGDSAKADRVRRESIPPRGLYT
jgi:hypothetical protein